MSRLTMKVGYYPGSFNPWHEGHEDILKKALRVFDRVIIAVGSNPDKVEAPQFISDLWKRLEAEYKGLICIEHYTGLMVDHLKKINHPDWRPTGIVRGLRNGYDLQYEMNQQYWNEDLGLDIPVVFFITDRKLAHVSSSAIRSIRKAKG